MAICTDFKAVSETNLGTVLSETKDVEKQRSGALRRMPTDRAEVVVNAGELRRETRRRNSDTGPKTENSFWTELGKTMTTPLLLRFG
jgi:hypothetical protein